MLMLVRTGHTAGMLMQENERLARKRQAVKGTEKQGGTPNAMYLEVRSEADRLRRELQQSKAENDEVPAPAGCASPEHRQSAVAFSCFSCSPGCLCMIRPWCWRLPALSGAFRLGKVCSSG